MACSPCAVSDAASSGSSGRTPFHNRRYAPAPCTGPRDVFSCAAGDRSWWRIPCCSADRSATWAWASRGSVAAAVVVLAGLAAAAEYSGPVRWPDVVVVAGHGSVVVVVLVVVAVVLDGAARSPCAVDSAALASTGSPLVRWTSGSVLAPNSARPQWDLR